MRRGIHDPSHPASSGFSSNTCNVKSRVDHANLGSFSILNISIVTSIHKQSATLTGLPPLISRSHLLFLFRQLRHARYARIVSKGGAGGRRGGSWVAVCGAWGSWGLAMMSAFDSCWPVTGFSPVRALFDMLGALVTLPMGGRTLCGAAIVRSDRSVQHQHSRELRPATDGDERDRQFGP